MKQMIAIASDHAGIELKEMLGNDIAAMGYTLVDLGPNDAQSVDYPDYANKLAEWLALNGDAKGVLICGSGIGMSIAVNRHKHVRAALVGTALEASLSRRHNNANVICLGARLIGSDMAKDCVKAFLATEFEGGRHQGRVEKLG